jgi:hypothetical protein
LSAQQPQVADFEDVEALTKKGFFKNYIGNLFKDFTHFGKPFDVSGGIGINMRSYSALNGLARQEPFFYTLNANANIRIYKLNLPFSIAIAGKNREATYPSFKEFSDAFKNNIEAQRRRFIRFGASPRYKWIKMHFGHRNMDFSQYTLSNLVFLGAGTELNPGKLRIAAMQGQLAKAEPVDLSLIEPNIPQFQRKGWGFKVGYGTNDNFIDLVLFQAKDIENSIFLPDTLPNQITPEQNQVVGLVIQKRFLEKFSFKLDLGASALSPNNTDAFASNAFPHPQFLFKARTSTAYKKAVESSLDYQTSNYSLGLQYRRIDPGYKTFGAYFFNSDLEEIKANLGFSLLKGSILCNASAGLQRNNISDQQASRTSRFISAFDATYSKGNFNISSNYSNHSSDINYLANPNDPILNVLIITQNAGFNASYILQDSSQTQHIFNLSGNVQLVTDDVEDPTTSAFSQMLLANFIYTISQSNGWAYNARLSFNQNELTSLKVRNYGLGLGISKSFLEGKLQTNIDFNYYYTTTEDSSQNSNFTSGLNLNWNASRSHSLNLNWNFLNTRNASFGQLDQLGEMVIALGYQYRFMKKEKQKE